MVGLTVSKRNSVRERGQRKEKGEEEKGDSRHLKKTEQ